jgi:competence/damage-inducible protein CinA-like protein
MPSAEIITIGTEILLGEIIDTNAAAIASTLRLEGIDVYRKTSVGDNVQRIAQIIQEALQRCDIVITTGGLGPTIDDPTRDAVALALGRSVEYHAELWEQIQERFRRYNRTPTENNRRQAYLPQGAIYIENAVGTAPCFAVDVEGKMIIALPGVPSEMEYVLQHEVMPLLRRKYPAASVLKMRVLHALAAGESQLDALIGEFEKWSNPTVGLAAHSGQVDVRICAKADTQEEAEKLIEPLEKAILERMGQWVYGKDEDTLEGILREQLRSTKMSCVVLEYGMGGVLVSKCLPPKLGAVAKETNNKVGFLSGEVNHDLASQEELVEKVKAYRNLKNADIGLGASLIPDENRILANLVLITPSGEKISQRSYGGPPKYAPLWAAHQSLYLLWQFLKGK